MKKRKKEIELAANRKATWIILALSIAITFIIKKYGKESKKD